MFSCLITNQALVDLQVEIYFSPGLPSNGVRRKEGAHLTLRPQPAIRSFQLPWVRASFHSLVSVHLANSRSEAQSLAGSIPEPVLKPGRHHRIRVLQARPDPACTYSWKNWSKKLQFQAWASSIVINKWTAVFFIPESTYRKNFTNQKCLCVQSGHHIMCCLHNPCSTPFRVDHFCHGPCFQMPGTMVWDYGQ